DDLTSIGMNVVQLRKLHDSDDDEDDDDNDDDDDDDDDDHDDDDDKQDDHRLDLLGLFPSKCLSAVIVLAIIVVSVLFAWSYFLDAQFGTQLLLDAGDAVPDLTQTACYACYHISEATGAELPCRACAVGLSLNEFCDSCAFQGLDDEGCPECPNA
ncbi:unnamed protein product, partial [Polarella glacialis]